MIGQGIDIINNLDGLFAGTFSTDTAVKTDLQAAVARVTTGIPRQPIPYLLTFPTAPTMMSWPGRFARPRWPRPIPNCGRNCGKSTASIKRVIDLPVEI